MTQTARIFQFPDPANPAPPQGYVGSAHYYAPPPVPAAPPAPVAPQPTIAIGLPTAIALGTAMAIITALLTYQSPSQQAARAQSDQIEALTRQLQDMQQQRQGLENQTTRQAAWITQAQSVVCTPQ